uniref:WAP domain-containing protein n=1 Tax=Periophthalmus magnuspinnatus TaxID=409849 RepID=A0A3B3ZGP2_9GOBI
IKEISLSYLILTTPTNSNCFSEKLGVCPKPRTDIHIDAGCLNECSSDGGCEGDLKCCFDGCGNVCEKPRVCSDRQREALPQ